MEKSTFKFSNPVLKQIDFKINDDFEIDNGGTVELKTKIIPEVIKKEAGKAICSLSIEVGGESKGVPFFIKVTEEASFYWNESLENESEKFMKQNAPALLLGYIRPIVAQITSLSKYPKYDIPFISFVNTEENVG